MKVHGIQSVNSYSTNRLNKNQNNQGVRKNDIQFTALVAQVAEDSYAPLVKKDVTTFLDYMKDLALKASAKNAEAIKQLKNLIGSDATAEIVKDAEGYTERLDKQSTKLSPLSGLGTRGEKICRPPKRQMYRFLQL